MRSNSGLTLAALAALAALPGCSCSTPEPTAPTSPTETVLELFGLTRLDDPAAERVDGVFGGTDDEQARAALLDAIPAGGAAGIIRYRGNVDSVRG